MMNPHTFRVTGQPARSCVFQEMIVQVKKFADLCQSYGGYLQIHSHGNINGIIPQLMETGVHILNPVGPTDGMTLEELLRDHGHQTAFAGGISKRIGEMTGDELDRHLDEVIALGKQYGSYIFRSEGGIPPSMTRGMFCHYMRTSRRLRAMLCNQHNTKGN